ncbi:von Willebrand factor A domain-containing protein 5B1 isoform X2 [Scleropages formosus]|uniref:von Willebrand factor A domain-containing protein 5B1 isoform X2 n=1 Tax=Scleropages formosus TaxID=113540 RepID=UPI0010FAC2B8|nr:von Willebrand factor A domain-containing protein 5B2 isoform X2 [Scleropages formosus]
MPGLRNRSTWEPLQLKASCVKSCANGYSLGITSNLTYANMQNEPVEGIFVYPMREREVVVGFEATVAGHIVGVQIQSCAKLEECRLDYCPCSTLDTQYGNGHDCSCCGTSGRGMHCTNGHIVLDEDLERTTFIMSTGTIGPMDLVTVVMSTTMEVGTLENGAVRLLCFGAGKQDRPPGSAQQCFHSIFTNPATSSLPYELSFQLLVRGACLLAGLESPTHALRADADPSAQSASTTYITLAEEHTYDRHVEIILHLSEPFQPQVILERGRLTFQEYEQQISARRDFIRISRKEAEPEKKMQFVRKRFHKDILCNPVLMLNLCPDLLSEPVELHHATRELFFLLDRSGSMSSTNVDRVKEGMLVAIKSLPPGTLLNIVGFGSILRTLFPSSRLCTNETLATACEYIQRMKADLGGTNLLGALSWVYQQPGQRSCPRQVFIITDRTVSNVGRVLELVRRHTCAARCFGLGLGPLACRRLLQGVAKVTGGNSEFLDVDERLQPKLIKALKKAFEPVLTDIRIDWYLPDNMEALLSPSEIPPIYPGNCLIGYCTLYDLSAFQSKKCELSRSQPSRWLSHGSEGSLSRHSKDELLQAPVSAPEHSDIEEALCEISREISSEFSCARPSDASGDTGETSLPIGRELKHNPSFCHSVDSNTNVQQSQKLGESGDIQCAANRHEVGEVLGLTGTLRARFSIAGEPESPSDVRLRIARASYVQEKYMLTHCSLSSERADLSPESDSAVLLHNASSLPQGLKRTAPSEPRGLTRWGTWRQAASSDSTDSGSAMAEERRLKQRALARSAMSGRSFSSPQGELDLHRLRRALEKVSFHQVLGGQLNEGDAETMPTPKGALSHRSLTDSNSLLFPASPLDWDTFTESEYLFSALPPEEPPTQCRAVIHGLLAGKPMSWEAVVDLSPLWKPEDLRTTPGRNSWLEIIHQLTARSVIRDFENMAEREPSSEHGLSKRYRTKAIQTRKGSNILCMYTAFTPINSSSSEGLASSMEMCDAGTHSGLRGRRHRADSMGLGCKPSRRDSEDFEDTMTSTDRDDTPASPCSLTSCDSSIGGSWNPASPSAASTRSQRSAESWSMESFFGSKFMLSRLRTAEQPSKHGPLKPHCLASERECESADYLPLVRLQLASGAFLLTNLYSECIQIPLDRLKRASPYTRHRSSRSPPLQCTSPSISTSTGPKPPAGQSDILMLASSSRLGFAHSEDIVDISVEPTSMEEVTPELHRAVPQVDSGRGSETDMFEGSLPEPSEQSVDYLVQQDLEGSSWATAVALAWLEHRCAGFFVEWELVAAKADFWLRGQQLPEGMDLASLKTAARQLFLLIRHWDENIKLNMLCYNPNNV